MFKASAITLATLCAVDHNRNSHCNVSVFIRPQ